MLSFSNYDNADALAKDLVQHFNESMAPIDVVFEKPSEMELLSLAIDKIEGVSNLGGKFLCKKANQGMGASFRVPEIMQIGEESYPLTITFAKRSQLGAFAYSFVSDYSKRADDAGWEQMVVDGILSKEEAESAKNGLKELKDMFPHTIVKDAKSFREMTIAKKDAIAKGDKTAEGLVHCRYLLGLDEESLVKAQKIYSLRESGVLSEADADSEVDSLYNALYPPKSDDPFEQISQEYESKVSETDRLLKAGAISEAEAEERKGEAFGEMFAKKSTEKLKKNRIWYWLIAVVIVIIIELIF